MTTTTTRDRPSQHDADGLARGELPRLPRWAQLGAAVVIGAVVVALARRLDPRPAGPRWLPLAIRQSRWVYLPIAGARAVGWIIRCAWRALSREDRSR